MRTLSMEPSKKLPEPLLEDPILKLVPKSVVVLPLTIVYWVRLLKSYSLAMGHFLTGIGLKGIFI